MLTEVRVDFSKFFGVGAGVESESEKGDSAHLRQTGGLCSDLVGAYVAYAQLLYHRTSITGSFTSLLGRVLISIHNLLVSVKCM